MKNKYTLSAAINLITLLIGLFIGFLFGTAHNDKVFAQAIPPSTQKVEEVTPGITVGTIGTNLMLAHIAEADNLIVNGYDVMKLQEGVLNYLSSRPTAERADIQNIINQAKAPTFYKMKEDKSAAPTPDSKEKKQ